MYGSAGLMLLLLATMPLVGQESPGPAAAGPKGTSGEVSSDAVGFATMMAPPPEGPFRDVMIAVAYPRLPVGSFVELTALDSGRTIVAQVVSGAADGAVVALSPGAARQLGVGDRAPVRVRGVLPPIAERERLLAGKSVAPRLDAPPVLLAALRRMLPGSAVAEQATGAPIAETPTPIAPLPVTPPGPARPAVLGRASPARGSWTVQVAALSSATPASALARKLGGKVFTGGGLYRVRLGPYADFVSAQRARDGIARAGYGDARILHSN